MTSDAGILPQIDNENVEGTPELLVCQKRRNCQPVAKAANNDVQNSNDDAEPAEFFKLVFRNYKKLVSNHNIIYYTMTPKFQMEPKINLL